MNTSCFLSYKQFLTAAEVIMYRFPCDWELAAKALLVEEQSTWNNRILNKIRDLKAYKNKLTLSALMLLFVRIKNFVCYVWETTSYFSRWY